MYKTTSINSLTCFGLSSIGGLYKTTDGGLSPPSLSSPFNLSTELPLTVLLNWGSETNGNPFQVQVASDSLFSKLLIDTLLNGTSFEIDLLELNTVYFWKVREKFGDLYSPWSEVWNFKTTAGAPLLSSPANNSIERKLIRQTAQSLGIF